MDNLEQQLGAVLGNPEMMEKIMSMAQALGTSNPVPEPQDTPPPPPPPMLIATAGQRLAMNF